MEKFKIYNYVPQSLSHNIKNSYDIDYKRGEYFRMSRISNNKKFKIKFELCKEYYEFTRYSGNYNSSVPNETGIESKRNDQITDGYGMVMITDGSIEKDKNIVFYNLVYLRFKEKYNIMTMRPLIRGKSDIQKFFRGERYVKTIILPKDAEFEILHTHYSNKTTGTNDDLIDKEENRIIISFGDRYGKSAVRIVKADVCIVNSYSSSGKLSSREVLLKPGVSYVNDYLDDMRLLIEGKE